VMKVHVYFECCLENVFSIMYYRNR